MQIPTIPNLAAGLPVHAADLNNIASTCTFLLTKPIARIHDITGGVAITTTYANVTFTTKDFDTDSMWSATNPERFTIQTPGWYKVRYSAQIASAAGGHTFNTRINGVTGANNPLGAGVTQAASLGGYAQQNSSGATTYAGTSGLVPYYLYTGDYLQVQIAAEAAGNSTGADASMPNSFFALEFASA